MILCIKEKHTAEYRLQSYEDFYRKLPEWCECYFYGLDSPSYDPDRTLYDIMAECPKYPDAVFIMAPLFRKAPWFGLSECKMYLLITDSFNSYEKMQQAKHYPRMDEIKWDGIFFHYLYALDFMKSCFNKNAKWHYWPNWAADCYDYEKNRGEKDIDFFLSGKCPHDEYEMRKRFSKAFHKSGLNFVDNFSSKKRINTFEDNAKFRDHLLRSRYSPHDGGINGRMVPRYVESAYAKSVIISPHLGEEMKRMGFYHGLNCLMIRRDFNKNEIRETVEAFVGSDYYTKFLANNAYELIKERHTTDCRIKEFLEVVNEVNEN